MLPFQAMENFPSKCPHPECRKKLSQDCILGIIPRPDVPLVNVVMRCGKCKKTFGFGMPAVIVQKFIDSLPEGKGLLANKRVNPKELKDVPSRRDQEEFTEIILSNPRKVLDEFKVAEEDEFFGLYDEEEDDD